MSEFDGDIKDLKRPERTPKVLRLDKGASLRVPKGYLGIAVRFGDQPCNVSLRSGEQKQNVLWAIDDALCFTDSRLHAEECRLDFLLQVLTF